MKQIPRDYWYSMELDPTRVLHRHEADIVTCCPSWEPGVVPEVYREMVVEREQVDRLWSTLEMLLG